MAKAYQRGRDCQSSGSRHFREARFRLLTTTGRSAHEVETPWRQWRYLPDRCICMRKIISPLVALAAIATMVASIASVAAPATAATEPSVAAGQFFALLNQARTDRGLPVLARDPGLDNLAIDWSTQMQGVYA